MNQDQQRIKHLTTILEGARKYIAKMHDDGTPTVLSPGTMLKRIDEALGYDVIEPLMTQGDFTYRNFLAVLVNSLRNPGDVSPFWLCMNGKAKKEQIAWAEIYFEQWKTLELDAQNRRRENVARMTK